MLLRAGPRPFVSLRPSATHIHTTPRLHHTPLFFSRVSAHIKYATAIYTALRVPTRSSSKVVVIEEKGEEREKERESMGSFAPRSFCLRRGFFKRSKHVPTCARERERARLLCTGLQCMCIIIKCAWISSDFDRSFGSIDPHRHSMWFWRLSQIFFSRSL